MCTTDNENVGLSPMILLRAGDNARTKYPGDRISIRSNIHAEFFRQIKMQRRQFLTSVPVLANLSECSFESMQKKVFFCGRVPYEIPSGRVAKVFDCQSVSDWFEEYVGCRKTPKEVFGTDALVFLHYPS